jgi:nitronate monooxygenase
MWPDRRIMELFAIDLPIIQAPMAGSSGPDLAIAVAEAGGLGSLPCAMLTPDQLKSQWGIVRQRTSRPINVNFFCHRPPKPDPVRESAWHRRLAPYYAEFGLDIATAPSGAGRAPFDAAFCDVITDVRPEVVSFHFGLPAPDLLARVKAAGTKVISSATTVEEARWLESQGCDAIIAQGAEAGGHRGMFLTEDVASQVGTLALVPQVADAIRVPVIAAGGIADGRGMVAALALGASAVQVGSAYLRCPEALVGPIHRTALRTVRDDATALTNLFTGRPARGIFNRFMREVGPIASEPPEFPLATAAVMPLRSKAESLNVGDFSPLWAGQAAALGREGPAADFTRRIVSEALALLRGLAPDSPAGRIP